MSAMTEQQFVQNWQNTTLNHAACYAYGWPHDILTNDDEILRRLLDLNLQRTAAVGEGL